MSLAELYCCQAIWSPAAWSKTMKVERFSPDPETEPRHWVRHDQAFAMMLRPGSIEWGTKRSALETFDYTPGDLALCDRHLGECDGCGRSCGDGCWLSERTTVPGFSRTGDGRNAGQWSCSKAPSIAIFPRRTQLCAFAED